MVQNDRFMCKHGRVSIDLEKEANSPDELAVVSEKQWKLLTEKWAGLLGHVGARLTYDSS